MNGWKRAPRPTLGLIFSIIIIGFAAIAGIATMAGCATMTTAPAEIVDVAVENSESPPTPEAPQTQTGAEGPDAVRPEGNSVSPPTPEVPQTQTEAVRLGFVGDVLMMTSQITGAKQGDGSYDFSGSFERVKALFATVDVMCGNFECTLAGEEAGYTQPRETLAPVTADCPAPTPAPYQSFNAPDELAANLRQAGFDLFTTANNHSLDRDDAGLFRTIKVLRAAGIATTGTHLSEADKAKPCVLEAGGMKIGFVGATEMLNSTAPGLNRENEAFAVTRLGRDWDALAGEIAACREAGAEFIILLVHWGVEYENTPNSAQQKQADRLIALGADAIIGSHPHVAQPMEWRQAERNGESIRVPVVYSLGNFISNMSQKKAKMGLFARLTLTRGQSGGVVCTELAYLPLACAREEDSSGRKVHQVLPCFENGKLEPRSRPPGEDTLALMEEASAYIDQVCGGENIIKIGWGDVYAGKAQRNQSAQ